MRAPETDAVPTAAVDVARGVESFALSAVPDLAVPVHATITPNGNNVISV
jgi:hypothetical protein